MSTTAPFWQIKIKDGVTVCVAPTIQLATGYILLEQEDWFEDEMDFIRALVTPDMNVFDIGANHGVYGLTIASRLKSGHVWAFEPTAAPGAMLARSIAVNGLADRLTWVHAGLSDHDGSAEISVSGNSETNSLYGTGGQTETISLYALDAFLARERIEAEIGFVKLDAEGEEINILAGGREFFSRQSPLVMFELRHGSGVNHGLIEAFQALGYSIYRLAPGLDMLVEYDPAFQDSFLLNLFACKPDCAERLAARDLLAGDGGSGDTLPEASWQDRLFALPFAKAYAAEWRQAASPGSDHDFALMACLAAEDKSLPPARRLALARQALARAVEITGAGQGDIALWLLRLNLSHMLGERALSVGIARKLTGLSQASLQTLKSPFLPPARQFYDRDIGPNHRNLLDTLGEFIEYRQSYSTYYTPEPLEPLSALTSRPGHGIALDRRLILMARRAGLTLDIARDHPLFDPATSANWPLWREIAGLDFS